MAETGAGEGGQAKPSARELLLNTLALWFFTTGKGSRKFVDHVLALHEAEVLRRHHARLLAIPVQCTALTGPYWYGQGWKEAADELAEQAVYVESDAEGIVGWHTPNWPEPELDVKDLRFEIISDETTCAYTVTHIPTGVVGRAAGARLLYTKALALDDLRGRLKKWRKIRDV